MYSSPGLRRPSYFRIEKVQPNMQEQPADSIPAPDWE